MELKLEPGRFISEKEVVEMLQVSRMPIREAFVKLSQEELIETIPQKGSFISLIELLRLQNLIALQELCVKENNDKRIFELDEEFHQEIIISCGRNRTCELLRQTATHYSRIRYLRLADNYDWELSSRSIVRSFRLSGRKIRTRRRKLCGSI